MNTLFGGRITVLKNNKETKIVFSPDKGRSIIKFGSALICDVRIKLETVKKIHCKIIASLEGCVEIINCSNKSPIKVNDKIINTKHKLNHNDKIEIEGKQFLWSFPKQITKKKKASWSKLVRKSLEKTLIESENNDKKESQAELFKTDRACCSKDRSPRYKNKRKFASTKVSKMISKTPLSKSRRTILRRNKKRLTLHGTNFEGNNKFIETDIESENELNTSEALKYNTKFNQSVVNRVAEHIDEIVISDDDDAIILSQDICQTSRTNTPLKDITKSTQFLNTQTPNSNIVETITASKPFCSSKIKFDGETSVNTSTNTLSMLGHSDILVISCCSSFEQSSNYSNKSRNTSEVLTELLDIDKSGNIKKTLSSKVYLIDLTEPEHKSYKTPSKSQSTKLLKAALKNSAVKTPNSSKTVSSNLKKSIEKKNTTENRARKTLLLTPTNKTPLKHQIKPSELLYITNKNKTKMNITKPKECTGGMIPLPRTVIVNSSQSAFKTRPLGVARQSILEKNSKSVPNLKSNISKMQEHKNLNNTSNTCKKSEIKILKMDPLPSRKKIIFSSTPKVKNLIPQQKKVSSISNKFIESTSWLETNLNQTIEEKPTSNIAEVDRVAGEGVYSFSCHQESSMITEFETIFEDPRISTDENICNPSFTVDIDTITSLIKSPRQSAIFNLSIVDAPSLEITPINLEHDKNSDEAQFKVLKNKSILDENFIASVPNVFEELTPIPNNNQQIFSARYSNVTPQSSIIALEDIKDIKDSPKEFQSANINRKGDSGDDWKLFVDDDENTEVGKLGGLKQSSIASPIEKCNDHKAVFSQSDSINAFTNVTENIIVKSNHTNEIEISSDVTEISKSLTECVNDVESVVKNQTAYNVRMLSNKSIPDAESENATNEIVKDDDIQQTSISIIEIEENEDKHTDSSYADNKIYENEISEQSVDIIFESETEASTLATLTKASRRFSQKLILFTNPSTGNDTQSVEAISVGVDENREDLSLLSLDDESDVIESVVSEPNQTTHDVGMLFNESFKAKDTVQVEFKNSMINANDTIKSEVELTSITMIEPKERAVQNTDSINAYGNDISEPSVDIIADNKIEAPISAQLRNTPRRVSYKFSLLSNTPTRNSIRISTNKIEERDTGTVHVIPNMVNKKCGDFDTLSKISDDIEFDESKSNQTTYNIGMLFNENCATDTVATEVENATVDTVDFNSTEVDVNESSNKDEVKLAPIESIDIKKRELQHTDSISADDKIDRNEISESLVDVITESKTELSTPAKLKNTPRRVSHKFTLLSNTPTRKSRRLSINAIEDNDPETVHVIPPNGANEKYEDYDTILLPLADKSYDIESDESKSHQTICNVEMLFNESCATVQNEVENSTVDANETGKDEIERATNTIIASEKRALQHTDSSKADCKINGIEICEQSVDVIAESKTEGSISAKLTKTTSIVSHKFSFLSNTSARQSRRLSTITIEDDIGVVIPDGANEKYGDSDTLLLPLSKESDDTESDELKSNETTYNVGMLFDEICATDTIRNEVENSTTINVNELSSKDEVKRTAIEIIDLEERELQYTDSISVDDKIVGNEISEPLAGVTVESKTESSTPTNTPRRVNYKFSLLSNTRKSSRLSTNEIEENNSEPVHVISPNESYEKYEDSDTILLPLAEKSYDIKSDESKSNQTTYDAGMLFDESCTIDNVPNELKNSTVDANKSSNKDELRRAMIKISDNKERELQHSNSVSVDDKINLNKISKPSTDDAIAENKTESSTPAKLTTTLRRVSHKFSVLSNTPTRKSRRLSTIAIEDDSDAVHVIPDGANEKCRDSDTLLLPLSKESDNTESDELKSNEATYNVEMLCNEICATETIPIVIENSTTVVVNESSNKEEVKRTAIEIIDIKERELQHTGSFSDDDKIDENDISELLADVIDASKTESSTPAGLENTPRRVSTNEIEENDSEPVYVISPNWANEKCEDSDTILLPLAEKSCDIESDKSKSNQITYDAGMFFDESCITTDNVSNELKNSTADANKFSNKDELQRAMIKINDIEKRELQHSNSIIVGDKIAGNKISDPSTDVIAENKTESSTPAKLTTTLRRVSHKFSVLSNTPTRKSRRLSTIAIEDDTDAVHVIPDGANEKCGDSDTLLLPLSEESDKLKSNETTYNVGMLFNEIYATDTIPNEIENLTTVYVNESSNNEEVKRTAIEIIDIKERELQHTGSISVDNKIDENDISELLADVIVESKTESSTPAKLTNAPCRVYHKFSLLSNTPTRKSSILSTNAIEENDLELVHVISPNGANKKCEDSDTILLPLAEKSYDIESDESKSNQTTYDAKMLFDESCTTDNVSNELNSTVDANKFSNKDELQRAMIEIVDIEERELQHSNSISVDDKIDGNKISEPSADVISENKTESPTPAKLTTTLRRVSHKFSVLSNTPTRKSRRLSTIAIEDDTDAVHVISDGANEKCGDPNTLLLSLSEESDVTESDELKSNETTYNVGMFFNEICATDTILNEIENSTTVNVNESSYKDEVKRTATEIIDIKERELQHTDSLSVDKISENEISEHLNDVIAESKNESSTPAKLKNTPRRVYNKFSLLSNTPTRKIRRLSTNTIEKNDSEAVHVILDRANETFEDSDTLLQPLVEESDDIESDESKSIQTTYSAGMLFNESCATVSVPNELENSTRDANETGKDHDERATVMTIDIEERELQHSDSSYAHDEISVPSFDVIAEIKTETSTPAKLTKTPQKVSHRFSFFSTTPTRKSRRLPTNAIEDNDTETVHVIPDVTIEKCEDMLLLPFAKESDDIGSDVSKSNQTRYNGGIFNENCATVTVQNETENSTVDANETGKDKVERVTISIMEEIELQHNNSISADDKINGIEITEPSADVIAKSKIESLTRAKLTPRRASHKFSLLSNTPTRKSRRLSTNAIKDNDTETVHVIPSDGTNEKCEDSDTLLQPLAEESNDIESDQTTYSFGILFNESCATPTVPNVVENSTAVDTKETVNKNKLATNKIIDSKKKELSHTVSSNAHDEIFEPSVYVIAESETEVSTPAKLTKTPRRVFDKLSLLRNTPTRKSRRLSSIPTEENDIETVNVILDGANEKCWDTETILLPPEESNDKEFDESKSNQTTYNVGMLFNESSSRDTLPNELENTMVDSNESIKDEVHRSTIKVINIKKAEVQDTDSFDNTDDKIDENATSEPPDEVSIKSKTEISNPAKHTETPRKVFDKFSLLSNTPTRKCRGLSSNAIEENSTESVLVISDGAGKNCGYSDKSLLSLDEESDDIESDDLKSNQTTYNIRMLFNESCATSTVSNEVEDETAADIKERKLQHTGISTPNDKIDKNENSEPSVDIIDSSKTEVFTPAKINQTSGGISNKFSLLSNTPTSKSRKLSTRAVENSDADTLHGIVTGVDAKAQKEMFHKLSLFNNTPTTNSMPSELATDTVEENFAEIMNVISVGVDEKCGDTLLLPLSEESDEIEFDDSNVVERASVNINDIKEGELKHIDSINADVLVKNNISSLDESKSNQAILNLFHKSCTTEIVQIKHGNSTVDKNHTTEHRFHSATIEIIDLEKTGHHDSSDAELENEIAKISCNNTNTYLRNPQKFSMLSNSPTRKTGRLSSTAIEVKYQGPPGVILMEVHEIGKGSNDIEDDVSNSIQSLYNDGICATEPARILHNSTAGANESVKNEDESSTVKIIDLKESAVQHTDPSDADSKIVESIAPETMKDLCLFPSRNSGILSLNLFEEGLDIQNASTEVVKKAIADSLTEINISVELNANTVDAKLINELKSSTQKVCLQTPTSISRPSSITFSKLTPATPTSKRLRLSAYETEKGNKAMPSVFVTLPVDSFDQSNDINLTSLYSSDILNDSPTNNYIHEVLTDNLKERHFNNTTLELNKSNEFSTDQFHTESLKSNKFNTAKFATAQHTKLVVNSVQDNKTSTILNALQDSETKTCNDVETEMIFVDNNSIKPTGMQTRKNTTVAHSGVSAKPVFNRKKIRSEESNTGDAVVKSENTVDEDFTFDLIDKNQREPRAKTIVKGRRGKAKVVQSDKLDNDKIRTLNVSDSIENATMNTKTHIDSTDNVIVESQEKVTMGRTCRGRQKIIKSNMLNIEEVITSEVIELVEKIESKLDHEPIAKECPRRENLDIEKINIKKIDKSYEGISNSEQMENNLIKVSIIDSTVAIKGEPQLKSIIKINKLKNDKILSSPFAEHIENDLIKIKPSLIQKNHSEPVKSVKFANNKEITTSADILPIENITTDSDIAVPGVGIDIQMKYTAEMVKKSQPRGRRGKQNIQHSEDPDIEKNTTDQHEFEFVKPDNKKPSTRKIKRDPNINSLESDSGLGDSIKEVLEQSIPKKIKLILKPDNELEVFKTKDEEDTPIAVTSKSNTRSGRGKTKLTIKTDDKFMSSSNRTELKEIHTVSEISENNQYKQEKLKEQYKKSHLADKMQTLVDINAVQEEHLKTKGYNHAKKTVDSDLVIDPIKETEPILLKVGSRNVRGRKKIQVSTSENTKTMKKPVGRDTRAQSKNEKVINTSSEVIESYNESKMLESQATTTKLLTKKSNIRTATVNTQENVSSPGYATEQKGILMVTEKSENIQSNLTKTIKKPVRRGTRAQSKTEEVIENSSLAIEPDIASTILQSEASSSKLMTTKSNTRTVRGKSKANVKTLNVSSSAVNNELKEIPMVTEKLIKKSSRKRKNNLEIETVLDVNDDKKRDEQEILSDQTNQNEADSLTSRNIRARGKHTLSHSEALSESAQNTTNVSDHSRVINTKAITKPIRRGRRQQSKHVEVIDAYENKESDTESAIETETSVSKSTRRIRVAKKQAGRKIKLDHSVDLSESEQDTDISYHHSDEKTKDITKPISRGRRAQSKNIEVLDASEAKDSDNESIIESKTSVNKSARRGRTAKKLPEDTKAKKNKRNETDTGDVSTEVIVDGESSSDPFKIPQKKSTRGKKPIASAKLAEITNNSEDKISKISLAITLTQDNTNYESSEPNSVLENNKVPVKRSRRIASKQDVEEPIFKKTRNTARKVLEVIDLVSTDSESDKIEETSSSEVAPKRRGRPAKATQNKRQK